MKLHGSRLIIVWIALFAVLGVARYSLQAAEEKAVGGEEQPAPSAEKIWEDITKINSYRDWKPFPAKGKEGLYPAIERGPVPAKNPHGAYMKLFVNDITQKAAQEKSRGPMPDGAVLVMENYGRDQKTFQSIHAMIKVKGFDPEHGDWFWAAYSPEGKVLEAGKVKSCIDCHRARKDNDWRWAGSRGRHKGHRGPQRKSQLKDNCLPALLTIFTCFPRR